MFHNFFAHIFAFISPIIFIVIVVILGFITPGYNHINHTISRLAIEQYGWIQTLNFIQLAIGFVLISKHIALRMRKEESRRIIKVFFAFSASILVLAALAPTDPIDNIRFSFSLLSPVGAMHVGTIMAFLFVFPYAFSRLVYAFRKESNYRRFASFTTYIGITAFVASIIWMIFFVTGLFLEYRGIFQKAIVLLGIVWIIVITYRRPFSRERL